MVMITREYRKRDCNFNFFLFHFYKPILTELLYMQVWFEVQGHVFLRRYEIIQEYHAVVFQT